MFRRLILVLWAAWLLTIAPTARADAWEKFIVPGLSYHEEIDRTTPRIIHLLRWQPLAKSLTVRSEIAGGRFYSLPDKGCETIPEMAERNQAIAGINTDFFPFAADPLGALVIDGELVSRPYPNRPVFAWGPNSVPKIKKLSWSASASCNDSTLAINGLNEDCPENGVTLYTRATAIAHAKANSIFIAVEAPSRKLAPADSVNVKATRRYENLEQLTLPEDSWLLAARGTAATEIRKWKLGQKINLNVATTGLNWKQITEAFGGGPMLAENGGTADDAVVEGFKDTFINGTHPRTAVGITATGEVIFCFVEGRSTQSLGVSLSELSGIMIKHGCVSAINLDGGGSSTLYLNGVTLNRPSDGEPRKVASGLLFFAKRADPAAVNTLRIDGPSNIMSPGVGQYRVNVADGGIVPNSEVLWSTTGTAWIDQSGRLSGIGSGTCEIAAAVRGQVLHLTVKVTGLPGLVPPSNKPED